MNSKTTPQNVAARAVIVQMNLWRDVGAGWLRRARRRLNFRGGTMFNTKIHTAATCAVAALFMTHPAWALNNRSWVVSFGSDNNNCTALFPCRTFQHAHDVTVDGGEVDVLDPGDYGGLLINKSITIDGGNMGYIQTSVAFVPAIIVDAPPTGKVILRRLSIESQPQVAGTTGGIAWFTGQALSIEEVSIQPSRYRDRRGPTDHGFRRSPALDQGCDDPELQ